MRRFIDYGFALAFILQILYLGFWAGSLNTSVKKLEAQNTQIQKVLDEYVLTTLSYNQLMYELDLRDKQIAEIKTELKDKNKLSQTTVEKLNERLNKLDIEIIQLKLLISLHTEKSIEH